jgi:hypothetical protein
MKSSASRSEPKRFAGATNRVEVYLNFPQPGLNLNLAERNSVQTQVFISEFFRRDEMVMTLGPNANAFGRRFKLEKRNEIGLNKLRAQWPTDCVLELCSADRHVPLNLNNAYSIFSALCLNWNHVVRALSIHTDIKLIGFDLPDARNTRAQVALK